MRLYLVRHAAVAVRPERPGAEWHLSPEGRAGAETLAAEPYWAGLRTLCSSPEPKAAATAQHIAARHGLPIRIEPDLREVGDRAWTGDKEYRQLLRRYLEGANDTGWEPQAVALGRVRACIDRIVAEESAADVAVVSHGLVLSLYLADRLDLDGNAAYTLWSRIGFPDVAVIDVASGDLRRGFGQSNANAL